MLSSSLSFPRLLRVGLWLLYVAMIGYVGLHHAPVRDELDIWLMTRDADFHQFITYFSYSGHPPLWHLLNLPFARWMGLPVGMQRLFPFVLASAMVWLLLFRSSFPLWLLIPCIFSVQMTFFYGVLARCYPLLLLLLFIVPVAHPVRWKHPIYYAVLLALLFQTEMYAWPLAGTLTLFFMADSWRQRHYRALRASVIPLISAMVALALVWPRPDAAPEHALHYSPTAFIQPLLEGFVPIAPFASMLYAGDMPAYATALLSGLLILAMIMIIALLVVTFISLQHTRSVWLFGAWLGGCYVILCCLNEGIFWHWGLIPLFLLFTLWFAQSDAPVDSKPPVSRQYACLLLAVALIPAVFIGVRVAAYEGEHPYSGSQEAAAFLRSHVAAGVPIIGIGCTTSLSVAAYLPKGSVWLDVEQRFTSFHLWDNHFYQCLLHTSYTAMLKRSLQHFNSTPTLWLYTNRKIDDPKAYGLVERYETTPFSSPFWEEHYWIYEKGGS